jgi:carbon storage regulator CsrA
MLVLTRKSGETVDIGKGIEVKVLSISRNAVKLGFSAPPQVAIRRRELSPLRQQCTGYESSPLPPAVFSLPLSMKTELVRLVEKD